jgi:hypothetical protein
MTIRKVWQCEEYGSIEGMAKGKYYMGVWQYREYGNMGSMAIW